MPSLSRLYLAAGGLAAFLLFFFFINFASQAPFSGIRSEPDARAPTGSSAPTAQTDSRSQGNTDVVLYVHHEDSGPNPRNLQFFVDHALHGKADFVFIINGYETKQVFPNASNIHVIRRENECYDLGSIGEVLRQNDHAILKKYKRFIVANASIRGPFFPAWARRMKKACWTEVLFSMLKDNVKLVGLTPNCLGANRQIAHLQSMMWATDFTGIRIILPLLRCFTHKKDAVDNGELAATRTIRNAGYDAVPLYSGYFAGGVPESPEYFWNHCHHEDVFYPAKYADGMDVHPFDTMFSKIDREGNPAATEMGMTTIEQLTKWADESKFSSYDQC